MRNLNHMGCIATLWLLICLALLPMACKVGVERQYQWDMARAGNRCNQGFSAYCDQLTGMNH